MADDKVELSLVYVTSNRREPYMRLQIRDPNGHIDVELSPDQFMKLMAGVQLVDVPANKKVRHD